MSKQISQLNSTNELNDNDIFPVVNDNTTKKLSFANLKTLLAQLFITNETDPTVPSWAKAPKKPSYSTSELTNDSGFVTKEVNDLTNYELKTKTGSTIEFSIDNTTHNITLKLKNSNGDILSEKTIQLENFVTESDFSTFTTQLNQVLQSLDETKADAEDVEALQTRVTELEQENEDLKKNQLTNTPEKATSHYLQDGADARFRKFIPIGRTTQESTTGKNLFNKEAEIVFSNIELNDWNVTPLNTGIRVKTTYTYHGGSPSALYVLKDMDGYQNKLVRIKSNIYISGQRIGRIAIGLSKEDGTDRNQLTVLEVSGNIVSVQIPSELGESHYLYVSFYSIPNQNATVNDYIDYTDLIVTIDNSDMSYEPYTGGEPAPNPNYPYAIKNTGDNVNLFNPNGEFENGYYGTNGVFVPNDGWKCMALNCKPNDKFVKSGTGWGANVTFWNNDTFVSYNQSASVTIPTGANKVKFACHYPFSGEEKLEQGSVATPYSSYGCGNVNEKVQNKNLFDKAKATDGYINFNDGSFTASEQYTSSDYIQIEEGQQYYSNYSTFSSSSFGLAFYNKNKEYIRGSQLINKITVPDNAKYIRFCVRNSNYSSGTYITDINTLYFVKGNSPTDYVPHSEQNLSFPLGEGQKFYEGSHPDDDEKVHHKMGEIVLDGTVGGYNADYNWFYLSFTNLQIQKPKTLNILSNYFKYYNRNEFANDTSLNGISFNTADISTASTFVIRNTNCTNATEYKNWLAEVLPIVQYELAEEQTEDFTEEQKTAWKEWKKARTYKNITHISSEDETPANVEIEYVRDINTIDDRITALEAKVDLLEE